MEYPGGTMVPDALATGVMTIKGNRFFVSREEEYHLFFNIIENTNTYSCFINRKNEHLKSQPQMFIDIRVISIHI